MSNNKQSSIDWFQEQIIKIVHGTCLLSEIEIFEQAKAMHKEEIIEAFWHGTDGDENKNDVLKIAKNYYRDIFSGEQ